MALLREIIKFVYRNKKVYADFLSLKPVLPLITADQQLMFVQAGFLSLLKRLAVKVCDILKET